MKTILHRLRPIAASPSVAAALLTLLLCLPAWGSFCNNPTPPCDPKDPKSSCYKPDDPPPKCEPEECDKCRKSPCHVGSGVYTTAAGDLQIVTNGFPIRVSRRYQSTHTIDSESGIGWISSLSARLYYAVYLKAAPSTYSKEVSVRTPDGGLYRFVENGDGSFTPPQGRFDTLVRNGDGTWDLWLQYTRARLRFAANGNLTEMVDDYGNSLLLTYVNDRLQRVADTSGSGRYVDVTYGADGRISDVTDVTGRNVHYVYDANGVLTSVTNPANQTTTYSYVNGKYVKLLSGITDPWGRNVTTIVYDAQDRTVSYTEKGETYTYTYAYNGVSTTTAKSDSSGNTWVYPFGSGGLVTDSLPPGGGAAEHVDYDGNGLVQLHTDPVGIKTHYVYNSGGNPLKITFDYQGAAAVEWRYTYDANFPEKVVSIIPYDPSTNAVHPHWQGRKFDYYPPGSTAPGALHHVYDLESDGTTSYVRHTFTYDARGRRLSETDAAGSVTSFTYDAAGNLATVTLPANDDGNTARVRSYSYDALGRVTTETNEAGKATTFTWDVLDRVLTRTDPKPIPSSSLVFTTTWFYDEYDAASGLLFLRTVDPNGRTSKVGVDQYSQVVQTIDRAGNVTRNVYTKGLQTSQIDANNNTKTLQYDARRRLWKVIHPDGTYEQYTYFADGRIASRRNRANETIAYTYDRHKRHATTTYPNGGVITSTHQGQKLVQVTDTFASPSETHSFTWDSLFRLTSNTQATRGTISFTYTADRQNLATQTVAGGATTTYGYYPDGSVRTIAWSPVSGTFTYGYTPIGETASITFPNGQTRAYSYDDQGRTTQVNNAHPTAGTLASFSYGYDVDAFSGQPTLLGMRTSVTATVPALGLASAVTNYGYNNRYELDRAAYPSGASYGGASTQWTYDALGNRLTATEGGSTANYTYNKFNGNALNSAQLSSDGANTYTYDAKGNTTARSGSRGNFTFSWDYENRLRSVNGDTTAGYLYDYVGRRTKTTVSGAATTYLYAGAHAVLESGAAAAEYLFGPGLDVPLAMFRGSNIYYYDVDALGSVVAVNDASGTVQNSYAWDAWGVSRAETVGVPNPLGYTAREIAEAGMQFNRFRYYEGASGSFRSIDPLALFGADLIAWGHRSTLLHIPQYLYADNTPGMATDPLGLLTECQLNCMDIFSNDVRKCNRDKDLRSKGCKALFLACMAGLALQPEAWIGCVGLAIWCEYDNHQQHKHCLEDANWDYKQCMKGCKPACPTPPPPMPSHGPGGGPPPAPNGPGPKALAGA